MPNNTRQLNRENLNSHRGTGCTQSSKQLTNTNRLVFGEVGNKIHGNGGQNENRERDTKPQLLGLINETTVISKKKTVVGAAIINRKIDKSTGKLGTVDESNIVKKRDFTKQLRKIPDLVCSDVPLSYSSKQLVEIIEIDTSENPLHVSEYVQDIYKYLLELEDQFRIEKNFLSGHKSSAHMRTVLINWMIEVHINFKLLLETLHLAVAIVDRYLQLNKQIGRDTLQLVGATAIWIAGKYEDIYILDLKDLVYICDNTFSKKQFLKMECVILEKLEFNLGRPLSLQFLRRFSRIAGVNSEQHTLGKYLLELALINPELCHVKPSLQAAAACCLAISILDDLSNPAHAWSKQLVHYSNYKYMEIEFTVILLACALNKIEVSKYKSIHSKYSSVSCCKISINPKLKGVLVEKLVAKATLPKKD